MSQYVVLYDGIECARVWARDWISATHKARDILNAQGKLFDLRRVEVC